MTYFSSSKMTEQKVGSELIDVLIVDDQKVISAKLEQILSASDYLRVVGMAHDGEEAITRVNSLRPDVIIMDITMPKMNGIEATKIISQKFPDCKILMLSIHQDEDYLQKVIGAGADGYILKNMPASDIIDAVYSVHKGYSYFETQMLKKSYLASSHALGNPEDASHTVNAISQLRSSSEIINTGNIIQSSELKDDTDTPQDQSLAVVRVEEFLPSISKWLSWGAMAVFTTIMIGLPMTSILKYKTKVNSQAIVRPKGELRLVQSSIEGKITKILITEGQAVKKGDLLAKIEPIRFLTRKKQMEKSISQQRAQIAQINSQIAIIDNQIIVEKKRGKSEKLTAEAELANEHYSYHEKEIQAHTQAQEAQSQVKSAEATLVSAQDRLNRFQAGVDKGAVSQEDLEETKLVVEQQKQEILAAKALFKQAVKASTPSKSLIQMAQQTIQTNTQSGLLLIAGLTREKDALTQQSAQVKQQLEQDLAELDQVKTDLNSTNITATAEGKVFGLKLRNPGQIVQPAEEIAQVIPNNVDLEIKTVVPTQSIDKLEIDQDAEVRISACPYPDFGTLKGKVHHIPKDTKRVEENLSGQESASAPSFYEVSISPQQTLFGQGEFSCSLELGMEGTVDIITKEETVLNFLLRKARIISGV